MRFCKEFDLRTLRIIRLHYVAISFFLFAIIAVGETTANDYYVSTVGSDSNPGTISQPFQTISKGIGVANPGDTILIREGKYPGFNINLRGKKDAWITIKSYPGEHVTIDKKLGGGSEAVISVSTGSCFFILDGLEITDSTSGRNNAINMPRKSRDPYHDIIIRNNEIHNTKSSAIHVSASGSGKPYNIQFINNHIHHIGFPYSGYGFYVGGNNLLFKGNIIHDAPFGMHNKKLYNSVIEDNIVYNCGGKYEHSSGFKTNGSNIAIWDDEAGDNNIIRNNIVYGARACSGHWCAGIHVKSSNTLIVNNIVYNNSVGIYTPSGKDNIIRNNILYKNSDSLKIGSGNTTDHNLIDIDPKFVNPEGANFHLQSSSPAINAGMTISEVTNDIEGTPRPQGGAYDIGAYEFVLEGDYIPQSFMIHVKGL